jgi:hypothetical protein
MKISIQSNNEVTTKATLFNNVEITMSAEQIKLATNVIFNATDGNNTISFDIGQLYFDHLKDLRMLDEMQESRLEDYTDSYPFPIQK